MRDVPCIWLAIIKTRVFHVQLLVFVVGQRPASRHTEFHQFGTTKTRRTSFFSIVASSLLTAPAHTARWLLKTRNTAVYSQ